MVKAHLNQRVTHTSNPFAQLDRIQQFAVDLDSIKHDMLASMSKE